MENISNKFETDLGGGGKIIEYIKNPFVCAAIIAAATYYIFSGNYITRDNIRERFPLKKQRTANIKCTLYVFLMCSLVFFLFKYLSNDMTLLGGEDPSEYMYGGSPPF